MRASWTRKGLELEAGDQVEVGDPRYLGKACKAILKAASGLDVEGVFDDGVGSDVQWRAMKLASVIDSDCDVIGSLTNIVLHIRSVNDNGEGITILTHIEAEVLLGVDDIVATVVGRFVITGSRRTELRHRSKTVILRPVDPEDEQYFEGGVLEETVRLSPLKTYKFRAGLCELQKLAIDDPFVDQMGAQPFRAKARKRRNDWFRIWFDYPTRRRAAMERPVPILDEDAEPDPTEVITSVRAVRQDGVDSLMAIDAVTEQEVEAQLTVDRLI